MGADAGRCRETNVAGRNRKPLLVVPRVVQPAAFYGSIFNTEDVAPIFASADVLLPGKADHGEIARQLDDAAIDLVYGSEVFASATAGELADYTLQLANRADTLLACFAQASDYTDPIPAAARVLQGPAGFIQSDVLSLDPESELKSLVPLLHALSRRAHLAAAEYASRKGAGRQPPHLELTFFGTLAAIYHNATGVEWTSWSTPDGRAEGTGVRFCVAIGEHLAGLVRGFDALPSHAVEAAIRRLRSPQGAADRIRDARRGGSVRKR